MQLRLPLLLLLLVGCGLNFPEAISEHDAEVLGVNIRYRIVPDGSLGGGMEGSATYLPDRRVIQLERRRTLDRGTLVWLLAHEVGHCLDHYATGFSHGGFRNEGCAWGSYYCSPVEGFAETYAALYITRCGVRLAPLGYPSGDTPCDVPHPSEVTPQIVPEMVKRYRPQ